jgi:hypothetical protein
MSNYKSFVAPFDMFGGQVKKGDVYVRSQSEDPYYDFEAKPGILYFHLPAEIVEKWEVKKTEAEIEDDMIKEIWGLTTRSFSEFKAVFKQNYKLIKINE